MFVVRGSHITRHLRCIRKVARVHTQTMLSKCRGCHIERFYGNRHNVRNWSRKNNSVIPSVLTSWSRAASSSSKDGKGKVSNSDTKGECKNDSGKTVADVNVRPSAETERMIKSIAEALKDSQPLDTVEKAAKLEGALSELEKLQLGKNNSSTPVKPTGSMSQTTEQRLHDLKIKTRVIGDIRKKQAEYYKNFTDNNYLEMNRAKEEYLLTDSDLESLPKLKRRNPYSSTLSSYENIDVVMLKDVLNKVNEKFGSIENMEKERKKLAMRRRRTAGIFFSASPAADSKSFKKRLKMVLRTCKNAFYHDDSGKVVFLAFAINLANAVFKFFVWMKTGSPSMFSEFMHSTGDTANQLMLAVGQYLSMKKPDSEHPYGYINHVNIMAIVSGVGIFCFGFGLTFYNGIFGLLTPQILDPDDLYGALKVLTGSLVSELATLFTAVVRLHQDSKKANVPFWKYVKDAEDPLVNVVLLEDLSAVLGVLVCGGFMSLGVYTGIPRLDAVGSLVISAMLGAVSYFIVHTNADVLLGRAIPYQRDIIKTLEQDRFVRSVMDSKGTDYGMYSRYKAELHLDGRQMALDYMETIDTEELIKKLQESSSDEVTELLAQFGEGCVDRVSVQIDRIEEVLKKKYPELRHIDLEV